MILAEQHYKAMDLIIQGEKISDIAKIVGVRRQSIYNWLKDEEFKTELDSKRQEINSQGKAMILNNLQDAVTEVYKIMKTSKQDKVRLDASTFIIEHALGKATTKIEQTTNENKNTEVKDIDKLMDKVQGLKIVK